jgi:hypothetical protein
MLEQKDASFAIPSRLLNVSLATSPLRGAMRGIVAIATNADQLNNEYRNPPESATDRRRM